MERVVGEQDSRATGRAAGELEHRLDRLGSAVREEASVPVVGHAGDERFGEQPRERWAVHLHEVRQVGVHRILERLLDHGMAPAEGEHAEPGEEVEVRVAGAVEEIRALGPGPLAVEAGRAQHTRHLRVEVPLVQRERFVPSRREQRAEIEAVVRRCRRCGRRRRARRGRSARGGVFELASQCRHCARRSRAYESSVSSDRSRSDARLGARRMRSARAGLTNPCSRYHRTARTRASRAGMLE